VSTFFFSLISQHNKKKSYFIWFLSKIYQLHQNKKNKKEKELFKKTFIGFCCRKQNKGKLDLINLALAQI